jgi:RHS repeat-associated protein
VYSYDALNRRSLVSYADGSTTQPTYDAANRLTQLADSSSGNLSWGYDGLNRVTSAVTPQASIGYTYDAAGRRTSMTPATQAIVNYYYDNANRLTSLTQGSETVQFGYDAANRRTSLILPNAVSMIYGYDAANELTGINYLSPTNTAMGALVYGYDLDGRRISKTGSFATDVLPATTTTPGTFDLNNRQTQFNGTAQAYDANGNLTSNGVNTFVWNARNQLTQITQGSTTQFSYAYDALGRRTSKSVAGSTAPTTYLYDGANAVQEAIGSVTNPILTGLGVDERFTRNDVNGRTDLLTDALNSTIALTDGTGAIKQQYSYDPYGNVTQSDTTTGFTNPYLYTGREADSAGLYYYRARYYSPTMGRFISEDPIGFSGGQNNFFAYVGGSPINSTDPSGLWQLTIGITYSPFAIGPGGVLTFGYNHGQFNLGGWLGASAGDAFSFNPANAPCHKPGSFVSTRADGRLGGGVLGVDYSAQSGPYVNSVDFSAGVPGVKSLEVGVSADNGEISTTGEADIVGGAQAFLGAGGQWYSGDGND